MISKIYYSIVAFLIIATLVACELFESGYGNKVDLSEPVVTIDSPVNGQYVSGTFILKGTATDDTSIKKINIVYTSNVTGSVVSTTATFADPNWSIEIDSSDENRFTDGEIEFTVTAIDSADKQTSKNKMVFSDNTIPAVLVNTPSQDDLLIVNGSLEIRGVVADQKLDKVELSIISLVDDRKISGTVEGTNSWKAIIDTTTLLNKDDDGNEIPEKFYIEVIATDRALNTNTFFYHNDDLGSVKESLGGINVTVDDLAKTEYNNILQSIQKSETNRIELYINPQADIPIIELDLWTYEEHDHSFASDVNLYGTILDDDGIDSIVLSVYKKSDNSLLREGTVYANGSRSFSLSVKLEDVIWEKFTMTGGLSDEYLPEGAYYFTISVSDIETVPNTVELSFDALFDIDKTAPVINIEKPSQDEFFNNKFKISGTATDEVNVSAIKIYVDGEIKDDSSNAGSGIVLTDIESVGIDGKNWIYEFDTTDITGRITIKAEVTDGSGKATYETVTVSVDSVAPVLSITNLTDGQILTDIDNFTISGNAIDDSGIKEIYYKLDGGTWTLLDIASASWEYYLTGLVDSLDKSFSVKAIDSAGNESSPLSLTFKVDSSLPTSTLTGLDDFGLTTTYYNSNISFSGNASDNNGIESVVITSTDSSGDITELLNVTTEEWSVVDLSLPDGVHELNINFTDKAGRIKNYNGRVGIDKTAPDFVITKPQDRESTTNTVYSLEGTSRDFGIGFDGTKDVEYSFDDGATWISIILNSNGSWEKDYDFGTEEGDVTFLFRSTDSLGNNVLTESTTLFYDRSAPDFTEVSYPNDNNVYVSGNVVFTGEVSDSHGIDSVKVSFDNGNTWSNDFKPSTGSTWIYNLDIDADSSDAKYNLLFRATDIADKSIDINRTVTVETTEPTVSIVSVTDYVSGIIPIQGNASDESGGSGLLKVEFQINGIADGLWNPTSIVTDDDQYKWTGTIDLSDEDEGDITLYARSVDNALNVSEISSTTIKVDKFNPVATISNNDALESNIDIEFTGTASDSSGLESVVYIWSLNGGGETSEDLTMVGDSWSYTLNASNGSGLYEVRLEATDIAGKVTTTLTQTAIIDTVAPVLTVSSPVDGESTTNQNFNISGSSSDAGVKFDGIDDVEYSFNGGAWTELNLTGTSWNTSIYLGADEGSFTLEFRSTDKLGNVVTLPTRALYFDNAAPTLTIIEANDIVTNTDQDFTGIVSDTNELSKFEVSIDGGTFTDITVDGDNSWLYSFDTDVDGSSDNSVDDNGTYSLVFKATDIAGKTTEITRDITIDVTVPTATVDAVAGYVKGIIGISGNSFDIGSGIATVEYQLNGVDEGSWIEVSGSLPWTYSLDLASASLGNNILYVRSKDYAGNTSSIVNTTIKVDKLSPVATITNDDAIESKSNIEFSGTASDDLELLEVKLVWSINGGGETTVPLTLIGDNWSYTLNTYNGNGLYELRLEATDIAGKVTTVSKTATIDTLAPVLTVNSPVDEELISDQNLIISGSSSDSGVKFDGTDDVEYSLDGGDWIELILTGISWSTTIDLGANEGNFTLEFRSTDRLGNITVLPVRTLYFDKANPVLTETTIGNSTEVIKKEEIVFTGKASDTNAFESLKVSKNGVVTDITTSIDGNNDWSYTLDTSVPGSFEIIFTAKDISGRITTETRNIVMDANAPTLPVVTSSSGDYLTNSYSMFGTASDATSGILKVEYSLDNIDWSNEANGTDNWFKTVDITSLSEGENFIYVRSIDKAGNVSLTNLQTIERDINSPVLTEITVATESKITTKDSVTFEGVASDTNELSTLIVSKNGVESEITVAGDNSWDYTLPNSVDGEFILIFTATDSVGRVSTVTRNILMDIIAPAAPLITSSFSSYETSSISIAGTSADDLTDGISKVEYSFDNITWTQVSGTSSWTKMIDISGQVDGDKTLYVRATDKAGNISFNQTSDFVKDNVDPTLTITGYVEPVYKGADFTITGTVSDNLELNTTPITVTASLDGGTVDLSSNAPSVTGSGISKDFSQLIPISGGEGIYVVTITGHDAVGRSLVDSRTITVDTQLPTVTIDNLTAGQLLTGTSYSISGSSVEVGVSGLDYVEYSVDGGSNWNNALTSNLWLDWTINLIGLTDTTNGDFRVRAIDKAGNSSTVTPVAFNVSTAKPETTIVGVDSSFKYVKDEVTISGLASDSNGVTSVLASYSLGGAANVDLTVTGSLPNWSVTLPTTEGVYDVTITVTDNTTEETIYTRSVAIDSTSVELVVTAPVAETIAESNSYEIRGTVTDNGGKGVTELQYSRDNSNWTDITISGLSWKAIVNFETQVGSETVQGGRTLYVRASDSLNPEDNTTINFNYDTANPVLTETTIGNSTEVIKKEEIIFTGKASDTNAFESLKVSKNGVVTDITTSIDGNNDWSYTLDTSVPGSFEIIFTAKDTSGRTSTETRNIVMDANAPTLPIVTSSSGDYLTNSYSIFGTASDATSGIQTVEYSLDYTNDTNDSNDTWASTNGTDNWSKTVDITSLLEGENFIYVRSTDKAGNVSLNNLQTIIRDINSPLLTETTVATESKITTKDSVTFEGVASDTNELTTLIVSKNGVESEITVAGDNSWDYTLPNSVDGEFILIFTATDSVGRVSTVIRNILMDIIAPAAPLITSSFSSYETSSISIAGTSADDLTDGISKVEYSFDNITWTQVSGTSSWTKIIDISGQVDGDKTLYVRATDKAGNISVNRTSGFVKDNVDPTLTITGYVEPVYKGADFTITGTVSDNLDLNTTPITVSAILKVDGDDDLTVDLSGNAPSLTGSGTSKDFSQLIPISGGEGIYVVTITGYDAVGRNLVDSRTITVDTQLPTITIDNLTADQLLTGTSYSISGSSVEVGVSGLDYVEYSVDGGSNWNSASTSNLWLDWTINLIGLTDTTNGDFRVRVIDKAGNSSTVTPVAFNVSTAKPETTIVGVDSSFKYVKDEVTITGLASDSNGITSVVASYSLGGATNVDLTVNGSLPNWSVTLPTTEGVYDVTITVTDNTTEETTYTRSVAIDSTSPSLLISSPASEENVTSSSYTLRGTVSDESGKGVTVLQYSRDDSNWTDITLSGLNWSVTGVDFTSPETGETSEGARTLYVRASDGLNTYSNENVVFYRDTTAPNISETNINTTNQEFKNVDFILSGTADDTVSFKEIRISATKDGQLQDLDLSSASNEHVISGSPYSYDIILPTDGSEDGEWVYTLTAYDNAGNSKSLLRKIYIDETLPVAPVISSIIPASVEDTLSLEGSASDISSGISLVEWSLDGSTNWTAFTGTDNWYGNATVSSVLEGSKTLYFRSTDRAGNISSSTNVGYVIDNANPILTVDTYNDYATDDFTITGSVTDTLDLGTAPISISVTRDGSNVTLDSLTYSNESSTSKDWSQVIPATGTDGTYVITVLATDDGGRFVNSSKTVIVESDIPSISGLNVSNGDTIGTESYTIIGSASDSSGIKLVEYSLDFTDDSVDNDTWIAVDGGTETWNAKLTGLTDVIGKVVSFRATDNANNIMTGGDVVSISFNVDLNAPVIGDVVADRMAPFEFEVDEYTSNVTTNQPYGGSSSEFALKILAKDTIGIKSIKVNIPGLGDVIAYHTGDTDGDYEIWTTDNPDTIGTIETIDISVLDDGTNDWVISVTDDSDLVSTLNKTVLIDNTAPVVTHLSPRHLDDIVNGEIEVKGLANDTGSGLNTIEYKVGYSPQNETWQSVSGSNFNWEIPFTESNKIDIYAGLEVDSVSTGIITKTSHGYNENTPVWIGADVIPAELDSLVTYYAVDVTANTFKLSTSTSNSNVVTFTTDINTVLRVSKYGKYLVNDSLWKVPVLIRALDNAGNVYEETSASYVIKVDPSGDKPTMSIVYPDPDEESRIMGGIIRIFGTAYDDDAVDSVYMMIDTNSDGIFDANDDAIDNWYNDGLGQVVDGTASWNMSINTNEELNPVEMDAYDILTGVSYRIITVGTTDFTGFGAADNNIGTEFTATIDGSSEDGTVEPLTKTILFKIRAKDINDVYGPWSTAQIIEIDKNVPKIGSSEITKLRHTVDTDTIQNYVADMWIKDNWILEGSIEDETGISAIRVTGAITGTLADNSEWFTAYDSGNGTTGYTMSIPVDTVADDSAKITFTITAEDNNEPKMSSSATFSINYDNKAPVLTAYSGTTPVEQSNKTYELTSTVNEDGAGLERVAYYFLRQGNTDAEDRVYNPMETSDGNVNRTYVDANLVMVDALPRLAITSGTRPSVYSISDALLVDNLNVRKGGLIKIGGLDRLITAFDSASGTVSWADEIDTSVTSAWIAYALIVDNADKIETPVWNGSVLESITNDDGDGVIEAIEKAGGSYEWSSAIDSHNIPDGPIEIHWVAYDKSGNYASDYVSTQVLNNRPRLSKVTLGTDLSGNGIVEAGEQIPAYTLFADGDEEGEAEVTIADDEDLFIAKGLTTVDIEIVGGNGDLKYELYTPGADNTFGTVDVPSGDDSLLHTLTALRTGDDSNAVSTINLTADTADNTTDLMKLTDDARNNIMFRIWDSTEETIIGSTSQWAELKLPIYVDIVDGVKPMAVISPFFWNSESDNSLYNNSRDNGHIEISGVFDGTDPDDVSGQISVRGTAYDDQRIEELYIRIDGMTMTGTANDTFNLEVYQLVATYNKVNNTWAGTDKWSAEGWLFTATNISIDQDGHQVEWQLNWDTNKVLGIASLERNIRLVSLDKGGNANIFTPTVSGNVQTYNEPTYLVDVVPYITSIETTLSNLKSNNPSVYDRTALGKYPVNSTETIIIKGFNLQGADVASTTDESSTDGIITLPMNSLSTGNLSLTVGGVSNINNTNDNDVEYNNKSNNDNNLLLTDDFILDVWELNSRAAVPISGRIADPVMKINPVSSMIGFAFTNGPLYFSMAGTIGGTEYSYIYWQASYDFLSSIAFEYDSAGYSYGSAAGGDINSSSADKFTFMTSRWGKSGLYSSGSYGGTNALRLESIGQKEGEVTDFNKYRIKSPQYATSRHGARTNIYLAYYDDINAEIRFRYGQLRDNKTTKTEFGNFIDSETAGAPSAYDNSNVSMIAGSGTGYNPSEYISIGVIPGDTSAEDVVVATWYDATLNKLWFSYNNSPTIDRGGVTDGTGWSTPIEIFSSGGQYCQLSVDVNNKIHIAAYDTANADLVYAYLDGYADNLADICTVDSYGIVGANITIDTAESASGQIIPYIGYYSNSSIKPKYAYLVDTTEKAPDGAINEEYTGAWEITLIPTTSIVPQDRINARVWKDASGVIKNSTNNDSSYVNNWSSYNSTSYGKCYGNGTSNGVLAYAITESTAGFIETAQKK